MIKARAVLEVALDEADRLTHSSDGMDLGRIAPIVRLAHRAFLIGDGDLTEKEVRESGLQPVILARLGL
jgi:hypothetical protein